MKMKMNKMLALASVFCYDKRVFRAGCDSRPASIVWMGEDERIALSVLIDL